MTKTRTRTGTGTRDALEILDSDLQRGPPRVGRLRSISNPLVGISDRPFLNVLYVYVF